MSKRKILVTGGGGYIGAVLVPALLRRRYLVTVVDNFMYRQNSLALSCRSPDLTVVCLDVRRSTEMEPLIQAADVIIPLAAIVGAPACAKDSVTATTTNRVAILAMLREALPKQTIIMPTTNSAYGSGGANNFCDEQSPLNPLSQYANEKVEVEQALLQHPRAISLRLATVFGMSPRMRLDLLVNDFTWRAVTDKSLLLFEGGFKRNYIHVVDVARAFLHALSHEDLMKGKIYNVGLSSANVSKKELCALIQKQLPDFHYVESAAGKDPDQRNYMVSNARIEALGYKALVSLDEGITELIKGYQSLRGSLYTNI